MVDYGTMLVKPWSGVGWENETLPMDRTSNLYIGGRWFTLANSYPHVVGAMKQ